MNQPVAKKMRKPLRVLKFGGTSVGDASAIARVVEIIRASGCESDAVVVVSAMSGVTNKLIEAGVRSASGKQDAAGAEHVASIFTELRTRHQAAIHTLIHSTDRRNRVAREIDQLCREGEELCHSIRLRGALPLPAQDAISSLGERLAAPLLAAVLAEGGIASEAIAATNLIQTDGSHGAAEPEMAATRTKCNARLLPLLQRGVVPVVTGFLGATAEGALTTLGRGGSDYSATILAAALAADEVTIWTDVDGMMTADPRFVPDAMTIAEISYREAAEMAHFGAKVLHPKTLSPVTEYGIPLWIRNTFAPERIGTCITPQGAGGASGVKGITFTSDATLFTLPEGMAARAEFEAGVAMLSMVGARLGSSETSSVLLATLERVQVKVLAAQHPSAERISLLIAKSDLNLALANLHRELGLGEMRGRAFPARSAGLEAAFWEHEAEPRTANAD